MSDAPPLVNQLGNLFQFILEQEAWHARVDNIEGKPQIGPPPCEGGVLQSGRVPDAGSGGNMRDCRFCPSCKTFTWQRTRIGSIVNCWFCRVDMVW